MIKNPKNFFPVTREDYKVISGALDIRDKRVRDVMTRVDKVFMLDASTRLNFDEMLTIYKSGRFFFFFFFLKRKKKPDKRICFLLNPLFFSFSPPLSLSLSLSHSLSKPLKTKKKKRLHPHPRLAGPPPEHHRHPLHEGPDPRRPGRRGRGQGDHRAAGLRRGGGGRRERGAVHPGRDATERGVQAVQDVRDALDGES